MNFTIFLKKDFLRQNNTVKEMLSQYDREGGYSDGLFSREEALNIITDAVEPIFARLIGKKNMVNSVFKYLDKDTGKGKDGYISYKEIDDYMQKTYNLKLSQIKGLNIEQASERVSKAYEVKKRQNKK